MTELPHYDRLKSYQWNYENPPGLEHLPVPAASDASGGRWTFCGKPVPSPIGVAAGPLLNGRWILYYAALGFDVLTYKTVRSRERACYPLPNLQPVAVQAIDQGGSTVEAADVMDNSWAISFGMPSKSPDTWRGDIAWTREQLPADKLLVVSVVATPEPGWSLDQIAADYAQCARWAVDGGADCIEVNFSCPNVSSRDGQLFQNAQAAAIVAQQVRAAIDGVPLLVKIGHVASESQASRLLTAVDGIVDAISMTNCLSANVTMNKELLFSGQPRGIGGAAIRAASVEQVRLFHQLIRERGSKVTIVGVGGIFSGEHARLYLDAGAEAVQVATAAMLDPLVGKKIKSTLVTPRARVL